jgi:hypothetical protein
VIQPFERFYPPLHTETELRRAILMNGAHLTDDLDAAIANLMAHEARCEHWRNNVYHVVVDKQHEHTMGDGIECWHLSFKRHDRRPIHDWRKVQAIKTAICGAECEAVELYPAESRVVDTANQYHLFAFPGQRLPFGFQAGLRTDAPDFGHAQQRAGSAR